MYGGAIWKWMSINLGVSYERASFLRDWYGMSGKDIRDKCLKF